MYVVKWDVEAEEFVGQGIEEFVVTLELIDTGAGGVEMVVG